MADARIQVEMEIGFGVIGWFRHLDEWRHSDGKFNKRDLDGDS